MAVPGSQEDIARAHAVLNGMLVDGEKRKAEEQLQREDRVAFALERIADALEARNAIDGQMAEFAELLQQGAPQVAHEGHPDLAPDGLPRKRR